MDISQFAKTINLPLCQYMNSIPYEKENKDKSRIWFLSGDPTVYGNQSFKMPSQGYEIMKDVIGNPNNHGYTQSSGEDVAKQAVVKLYNSKIQISEKDVIIHHGVNQGLISVITSFVNPDDEILVPQIGYPFFKDVGPAYGVKVIPYKLKSDQNFQIDLNHLATLITERTQFMFVINPSNPMGTVYSKTHMEEILKFADKHQLPIVSDQVYFRQTFPEVEYFSFGELTVDVPVIVLCGVQKIMSVPGWCTSWAVIFDKNNYLSQIRHNLAVASTIFLHSNKFTQIALPKLLDEVGIFTTEKLKDVKEVHDHLLQQIKNIKGLKPIQAHGTTYLTTSIDVNQFKDISNDRELVNKLLEEQNINVLPLSIFGGELNGFRILTCAKKELYEDFLERMKQFVERHS